MLNPYPFQHDLILYLPHYSTDLLRLKSPICNFIRG